MLGRKSVLAGIAASMGGVLATAAPPPRSVGLFPFTLERPGRVVVGPGEKYTTLEAVFADYPQGGVDIDIKAPELALPAPISVTGVSNVSITGSAPFGGTKITTAAGFIAADGDSDCWTITNLEIAHAAGTNTDDGILVEYPRRWSISKCTLSGFGGSTIHYRGGLHSEIVHNYILSGDSTDTNGIAGIHIERMADNTHPTTMLTRGNFIGAGKQYGLLVDHLALGIHQGDIAEYCDVGMRFERSDGELSVPYTEEIAVTHVELHDSLMTVVGHMRVEPTVTWSAVDVTERFITRIGRNFVNPGKAIVSGNQVGGADPDRSPSIRWGDGDPEGKVTAVRGSTWYRTDGGVGATLYVKETGTGDTGWAAK